MSGLDPVVGHVIAASLALLFAAAAIHKLRDLRSFGDAVAAYELVPGRLAPAVAALLTGVEVAGAGGVLFAATRPFALATLVCLLLLYAMAMGVALARGRRDLDCGCFGPARRRPVGVGLVARNLALAALGALALLPSSPRALVALDAVTGVAGVASALLLLAAIDQALANAPALRPAQTAKG